MADQFVMCTRAVEDGSFIPGPGPALFMLVPGGEPPSPRHAVKEPEQWFKKLRIAATWAKALPRLTFEK